MHDDIFDVGADVCTAHAAYMRTWLGLAMRADEPEPRTLTEDTRVQTCDDFGKDRCDQ